MCLVDGCEKQEKCRGYCSKHYEKLRKYGSPLAGKENIARIPGETCCVDGCSTIAVYKGMCRKHYVADKKYGSPLISKRKGRGKCIVDGCNGARHGSYFCDKHYRKFKKYGDPLLGKENKRYKEEDFCSFPGCNKKASRKGKCNKHYYEERNKNERVKEKQRDSSRRRRAQKTGATSESFSSEEIFILNNWVCGICGKPVNPKLKWPHPKSASLDHIIPLARGGSHTRNNVQLAHLRCNLVKQDKLPEEL